MRQTIIKVLDAVHGGPRRLKATGWIIHDVYFCWAGFNFVTGLTDEAFIYAALVMTLTVPCSLYTRRSTTFSAKTYATVMSCALLGVIAYILVAPLTSTQPISPPQGWAITLQMSVLVMNRFNVAAVFNIVLPDMKLPPDQRLRSKRTTP